jgi:hypothetical protein
LGEFSPFGRFFTWAVFLKITEVDQLFGLHFYPANCDLSWEKIGWATLWAIFSQTHLATLVDLDDVKVLCRNYFVLMCAVWGRIQKPVATLRRHKSSVTKLKKIFMDSGVCRKRHYFLQFFGEYKKNYNIGPRPDSFFCCCLVVAVYFLKTYVCM